MDQDNRDQHDRDQFCAFFRRSRYDTIQARQSDGWGPLFSFVPCDARAAQKAGQMMVRMHQGKQLQVRHARRARLRDRQQQAATDVVVLTTLPEQVQEVFGLNNGVVLRVDTYLQDDALTALEAEVMRSHHGTVSL